MSLLLEQPESKRPVRRGPYLPAEPFRHVIRMMIQEHETIENAARALGFSARRLYSILNDQETISFDVADQIVTKGPGPHYWLCHPELAELYFTGLDLDPKVRAQLTRWNERASFERDTDDVDYAAMMEGAA